MRPRVWPRAFHLFQLVQPRPSKRPAIVELPSGPSRSDHGRICAAPRPSHPSTYLAQSENGSADKHRWLLLLAPNPAPVLVPYSPTRRGCLEGRPGVLGGRGRAGFWVTSWYRAVRLTFMKGVSHIPMVERPQSIIPSGPLDAGTPTSPGRSETKHASVRDLASRPHASRGTISGKQPRRIGE